MGFFGPSIMEFIVGLIFILLLLCTLVKATPVMRSVSCMHCSSVQSLQCSAVEFIALYYRAGAELHKVQNCLVAGFPPHNIALKSA